MSTQVIDTRILSPMGVMGLWAIGVSIFIALLLSIDYQADKRDSVLGILDSMRSDIQETQMRTGTWPTLDDLMEQTIPKNIFQYDASAPDSIVTGVTKGVRVGFRGGWAYNPSTGEIWSNTASCGENRL